MMAVPTVIFVCDVCGNKYMGANVPQLTVIARPQGDKLICPLCAIECTQQLDALGKVKWLEDGKQKTQGLNPV